LVDGDIVDVLDEETSSFVLTGLEQGQHSVVVRAVDHGGNVT
jgi:hypothetical protein